MDRGGWGVVVRLKERCNTMRVESILDLALTLDTYSAYRSQRGSRALGQLAGGGNIADHRERPVHTEQSKRRQRVQIPALRQCGKQP